MNLIDLVFIILFVWSVYKGFTKGFIIVIASFCALIIGIYGAIKLSGFTAIILAEKSEINHENIKLIAFALTFVLIVIATHLTAFFVDKLVNAVALGFFNRMAGAFFNLFKTAVIISVFLVIFEKIDEKVSIIPRNVTEKSALYSPLRSLSPLIYPYLRSGYEKFRKNLPVTDEIIAGKN